VLVTSSRWDQVLSPPMAIPFILQKHSIMTRISGVMVILSNRRQASQYHACYAMLTVGWIAFLVVCVMFLGLGNM